MACAGGGFGGMVAAVFLLWPSGMNRANQIGTVSIETTVIAVGNFSHAISFVDFGS